MGSVSKRSASLGAVVLSLLFLLVVAAGAQAAPSFKDVGSIGAGELPKVPIDVAVDETTGNVLVAVPTNGSEDAVRVYGPDGAGAPFLTEFGADDLQSPSAIAVDPESGDVYVSNNQPGLPGRIFKFTSDGAAKPTYTIDNTYTSPVAGTGEKEVGDFDSRLAIDPKTGDLLIADRGNHRVSRYDPSGEFVSSFDGADTAAGAFTNLRDITVASNGDIYVVDLNGFIVTGEVIGTSRVERFGAGGESLGRIGEGVVDNGVAVAYDSKRALLAVAAQFGSYSERPPQLSVFQGNTLVDQVAFPAEVGPAVVPGIAIDNSSSRLYGLTSGTGGSDFGEKATVQVFEPVVVPVLTIAPADAVTSTSAHFSGTIDPDGKPTEYAFEYSRDGGVTWLSTPSADAGEGEAVVPVEATATALVPNSDYLVRLAAHNEEAGKVSGSVSFHTLVAPPRVVTGDAVEIEQSTATLHGAVTPFGQQATYHFEYGPTQSYGSRTPASYEEPAGGGYDPAPAEGQAVGLQPGVTYHYRLVAQNASGPSYGEDRTFVAGASPLAPRAYELITELAKGSSEVDPLWAHAGPDGETISFQTQGAIPGISGSAPYFPRYFARRSAEGWGVTGLDPPVIPTPSVPTQYLYGTLAISPDRTKAVVLSAKALAPGGVDGDSQLYLEDIASKTFSLIARSPGLDFYAAARYDAFLTTQTILGGNQDFSKVYFYSYGFPFAGGVAGDAVYEWSDAGLGTVSEDAKYATYPTAHVPRSVSADGSRVVYKVVSTGEIWGSENGEDFHVSGPLPENEEFVGASADGRYVFTIDGPDLYRFDVQSRELLLLAEGLPQQGGLSVSSDGRFVYYFTNEEGGKALWVWHDGENHLVHRLGPTVSINHYRLSENGRYFVLSSPNNITGFDNRGFEEFYRYDVVTEQFTCASCRTDGRPATGDAEVGEIQAEFEQWHSRLVADNGEVFFDTPDQLSPRDVNSSRDVYASDGSGVTLVSSGAPGSGSRFVDAGEDGWDVFFATQDPLVATDTDNANDLYDARRGGGLPGQNPPPAPPAPPGCLGEGCRGALTTSPPRPPLGSEALAGPARRPAKVCRRHGGKDKGKARGKARCGKGPGKHEHRGRKHQKNGHRKHEGGGRNR